MIHFKMRIIVEILSTFFDYHAKNNGIWDFQDDSTDDRFLVSRKYISLPSTMEAKRTWDCVENPSK